MRFYENVINTKAVIRVAQRRGVNGEGLLQKAGIDPGWMADPFMAVGYDLFEKLFRATRETLEEPALGLRMGQFFEMSSMGRLALVLSTAKTMHEAIRLTSYLREMTTNTFRYHLTLQKDEAVISIVNQVPFSMIVQGMMDFYVTVFAVTLPAASGTRMHVRKAHLPFPEPEYSREHAQLWPFPTLFGQQAFELFFEAADLDQPMPAADPAFNRKVWDELLRQITSKHDPDSISEKVREIIASRDLESEPCTVKNVAAVLRMSVRTLQMKINEEGNEFSRIRDGVRFEKALDLLKTRDKSIETVSKELGFRDFTSFYKAFRRWTSQSPRNFYPEPTR